MAHTMLSSLTNMELKPNNIEQLTKTLHIGETKRVVISPELASQLFEARLITRTIKPEHAAAIASDMRDGYWVEKSPVPIIIDPRGVVIDGQHRLAAILSVGLPVVLSVSMVSQQLAEELVSVIDIGKGRSPADRLRVLYPELANTKEIVAWIGAMCLLAYRTPKLHKVRNRIASVYEVLQEPINFCNSHRFRPAIIQGATAFAWVYQPEAATEFALQFTGSADRPSNSPVALLERALRDGTYGSVHASRYDTAAKVVAVIDALAEGRTLKRLQTNETLLDIYRHAWRERFPNLDVELTTAGVPRSKAKVAYHSGVTLPSPPPDAQVRRTSQPPASASGLHSRTALASTGTDVQVTHRARGRPRKRSSG